MSWSGSWNSTRTAFSGTYTAPDGSVFEGTWTPARGSVTNDPPAPPAAGLSSYDPYTHGVGPRADSSDSTKRSG